MTSIERHIIESYSEIFEGLSRLGKLELIEKLKKSLKREKNSEDEAFFKTFGAFESDKSAEELITKIKESRTFRHKDLKF